ncbi:MAG: hypothetical protein KA210_11395 [Bacteroidia bacterium]|jgi:hypothetical protein|nr:hypothetical protein [Bacteroidia bacterium]
MKNIKFLSSMIVVSSILIINGCKKKAEVDNETQSVVDNAMTEQLFMSIQPTVSEKGIKENGIKRTSASCETWTILGAISGTNTPNVAIDTLVNASGFYQNGPVSFEIDYGTTGCLGSDGVYRKGKLKITTAKRWKKYGNTITVDLIGFNANSMDLSGQVKITYSDSVTLATEIINGRCSNGTWQIDYSGVKTMKQIAGYSTKQDGSDDIYSIGGTTTGKNREGRNYTTTITNNLIKKSNCKWITSGTLELSPDGFRTRTVDFGNGSCDDDATFTVNGQTISFKLQ